MVDLMMPYIDFVLDTAKTLYHVFTKGLIAEIEVWRNTPPDFTELRKLGLNYPAVTDAYAVLFYTLLFLSVMPFVHLKVLPALGQRMGLHKHRTQMKFADAALQLMYWGVMLPFELWVCLREDWAIGRQYFTIPSYPWNEYMRQVYLIQCGWYFFCLAENLFVPSTRRKDASVMITHHVVTLAVVLFSMACNHTRIGVVVFALHDAADVFMNAAKVARYFKYSRLCDSLFVLFVLVWVISRLVLFPIVINTAYQSLKVHLADGVVQPGDMTQTSLLVILLVMHVYWTTLIARMAYRAIVVKEVEGDIRSDDE